MEGFGRILALPADHPQTIDYINNIRSILSCEATFNRLQMSAELQNCKKVVTTPGGKKKSRPTREHGGGGRNSLVDSYSTTSFSMMTFTCAVTSLCSFTGTSNSPTAFRGSCN